MSKLRKIIRMMRIRRKRKDNDTASCRKRDRYKQVIMIMHDMTKVLVRRRAAGKAV